MNNRDPAPKVEDEAARAGWLYYVSGMTQDEIAQDLNVSRQRAQRLVSRAVSEGLIHVRLDHPIAKCLSLEAQLVGRFALGRCRVAPSLPKGGRQSATIAPIGAAEIEKVLRREDPLVIALGTGQTMQATIDEVTQILCGQHRIVSLSGTIGADGAATSHDVIMRIAEKVRAHLFPMPVPVICETAQERAAFHALRPVRLVADLARAADETFVGIGQMGEDAPLFLDGLISREELLDLRAGGAAGEIAGWVFDSQGTYFPSASNSRVGGARVEPRSQCAVTCLAAGPAKVEALSAALRGNLINGLITDERTAQALLDRV